MTCPNCGAAVAPGERFCGECGHPVAATGAEPAAAPGQTCPHCGAHVAAGERFCGECGRALTAGGPPAPAAGAGATSPGRTKIAAAAAAVLLVVGGGSAFFLTRGDDDKKPAAQKQPAGEIFLEPVASVGRDPFTPSLVPQPGDEPEGGLRTDLELPTEIVDRFGGEIDAEDVAQLVDEVTSGLNPAQGTASNLGLGELEIPAGEPGRVPTFSGSSPGLYGGTQLIDVCDKARLIAFLGENPGKARAWARVQGIQTAIIGAYVSGLTDVVLQVDTRVTNHGFRNGSPNAIDSVLQAGTAVLVDALGVPRVRCACGNPLLPPRTLPTRTPKVAGTKWPGFALPRTVAVQPADPVEEFAIDDVLTQDSFVFRRPGTAAAEGTLDPSSGDQPPAGGDVSLVHAGTADEVGPGPIPTPDGGVDAHFVLTVSRPGTIVDIDLRTADPDGNPCCGQVWNTSTDTYWILGAVRDGRRLNPVDLTISDTVEADARYDLYANDSGYFTAGQNFVVTVTFDDGTTATAVATYG